MLQINQGEADDLRVEVKNVLKKAQLPRARANINREEMKAIGELRGDDTRMILTTDKGVALVVMDKDDYIKKPEDLSTYKLIPADCTTRQKNKLINLLKHLGRRGYH